MTSAQKRFLAEMGLPDTPTVSDLYRAIAAEGRALELTGSRSGKRQCYRIIAKLEKIMVGGDLQSVSSPREEMKV